MLFRSYLGTMDERGLQTTPVPKEWWGKERRYLKLSTPSWHHDEIKRMLREYGKQYFELRGVPIGKYV